MNHKTIPYSKVILALSSILLFMISTSCQKAPINGVLDGQWQVMEVSPEPETKLIEGNLYYCFYLHVCQLSFYDGMFATGNMSFNDESLYLDFPSITSPFSKLRLAQYGINENPITFTVEHIDRKSLILRHGDTTVTMRKF